MLVAPALSISSGGLFLLQHSEHTLPLHPSLKMPVWGRGASLLSPHTLAIAGSQWLVFCQRETLSSLLPAEPEDRCCISLSFLSSLYLCSPFAILRHYYP